ncbi:hypothetical protein [Microcoleus sp.]
MMLPQNFVAVTQLTWLNTKKHYSKKLVDRPESYFGDRSCYNL